MVSFQYKWLNAYNNKYFTESAVNYQTEPPSSVMCGQIVAADLGSQFYSQGILMHAALPDGYNHKQETSIRV